MFSGKNPEVKLPTLDGQTTAGGRSVRHDADDTVRDETSEEVRTTSNVSDAQLSNSQRSWWRADGGWLPYRRLRAIAGANDDDDHAGCINC